VANATTKSDDGHGEHAHGIGRYLAVWLALIAGTVLTVITGRMDLGAGNIFVAITIASVKATLVVLFFMHVRYGTRLTPLVIAAGLFWLVILIALSLTDYLTRGWLGVPGR
jgi:cytochrome c oxidase subunit 4